MTMRFARVSPALALTVGALAIAGCGGSSSSPGTSSTPGSTTGSGATLTPNQWKTQVQAISGQLSAAFAPIKTQGRSPDAWFTLADKLKAINAKIAAIKPPPIAAGVTSAISSGLQPLPDEATTIGNDLKNNDQTQAKKDAVTLEKSLFSLLSKISNALLKLKGSS
jgi:ABC-type glycerol-3-phosphate transport system substrate-binding protein